MHLLFQIAGTLSASFLTVALWWGVVAGRIDHIRATTAEDKERQARTIRRESGLFFGVPFVLIGLAIWTR